MYLPSAEICVCSALLPQERVSNHLLPTCYPVCGGEEKSVNHFLKDSRPFDALYLPLVRLCQCQSFLELLLLNCLVLRPLLAVQDAVRSSHTILMEGVVLSITSVPFKLNLGRTCEACGPSRIYSGWLLFRVTLIRDVPLLGLAKKKSQFYPHIQ